MQLLHDLEHAARRRHAAPFLEQYVEAHGHDDQGLDVGGLLLENDTGAACGSRRA